MGRRIKGAALKALHPLLVLAPAVLCGQDVLSVGYGEGMPGGRRVAVAITARHDLPIHGYSVSLTYPRGVLRLLEITPQGTAAEEVGVDFFQEDLNDDAGTAVLGVILSFKEPFEPSELPPTEPEELPQLLAWLIFDVAARAPAGEHAIRLVDGLGDPPISNRFTYRGTTIRPSLEVGTVVVQSENVLTLESRFAIPGFRIDPIHAYARHSRPLQGFQMAVSFDPRALTLESATWTGTTMLQLLGSASKIEFSQIKYELEDILVSPIEARTTAGVIFDYLGPFDERQSLPPETGSTTRQSILRYSFQPKEGAEAFGEFIPLSLSESPSPDAVNNVFIAESTSFVPRKVDGRIYFSTGFLTGSVVDYRTGAPLAGVTMTSDPGGHTSITGAGGAFRLGGTEGIPPGPYSVSATRAGYFPGRMRGAAPGKGETADLGALALFAVPPSTGFRRGFVNADTDIDISDGIALLDFLFLGGTTIACQDAADTNDDGDLDLSDAIAVFGYLFTGDAAPPAPFALCGEDPTADFLDCVLFTGC